MSPANKTLRFLFPIVSGERAATAESASPQPPQLGPLSVDDDVGHSLLHRLRQWLSRQDHHHRQFGRLSQRVRAPRLQLAGIFNYEVPGSLLWRLRNVMLGSVLGATVCFPLGWLHLKLVEKANEEKMAAAAGDNAGVKGGVGGAIERLDEKLTK